MGSPTRPTARALEPILAQPAVHPAVLTAGVRIAGLCLAALPGLALAQVPPSTATVPSPAVNTQSANGQTVPAPVPGVHATDKDLADLIPDSAVANPEQWALDTDAAHGAAGVTGLVADQPLAVLPDLPGITIPWPDTSEPPAPAPLTPDPDIDAAADLARQAGEALDSALPAGGAGVAGMRDMRVEHLGGGIDLAVPAGVAFAQHDALVQRFTALSALRTLDKGNDNLAQVARRAREDAELLLQILRLEGYYDAEVSQTLEGLDTQAAFAAADAGARSPVDKPVGKSGDKPGKTANRKGAVQTGQITVRFNIAPGNRFHLGHVDLGDVAQASQHEALLAAFALHPGDPADTDLILAARGHLSDRLGDLGYTFAKVGDPALAVDHDTESADLTLPVTTGGRYRFGAITSSLPAWLNAPHLRHIARFRSGQIYERDKIDDFRKAILATGIVGSVTITPREVVKPQGETPGTADVDVKLTKGPSRTIGAQVGQSSGEGFKLEASWENRNIFPPEGMVRFHGILGTREQLIGSTFRRSNFLMRDQSFTADLFAQTLQTDAYDAHTISAIGSIAKQSTLLFQKRWAYSLGVEIVATRELATGAPPGSPWLTYFIGALPMKLGYDHSNDLLDPTRGFRITPSISPEISIQDGPRSSYLKSQLDMSGYVPVTDAVVLAGRTRLGSIHGTDIMNIAPSRRFYAGGAASVRGYGYQAVGPKDPSGNPLGGLSLTEFSLELRVRTGLFGGGFGIVPFLDAGTIGLSPRPTTHELRYGAGIGVRYKTPFGPIRLDIGTPLNPTRTDSRIGVYIALGQAF